MSKKLIYSISFVSVLCLFPASIANAADPNLVGWWKCDGSGTAAIDSSGNGFDIPLHNTTWEDGLLGGALHFHGVGYGYVENFNYSDNAITVCAWVRHDAFRIGQVERYVTVAPEIAVIRKDRDSSLHFYIKTDGNLRHLWVGDVLTEGRWHHVAGAWDGSTQRLYIEGVEIAGQVPGGVLGSTSNVEMSSEGEPLDGMLDEVRIYNRALTQDEIQVIVQEPERVSFPVRGESGEIILGLGTLEAAIYSPDGKYIATAGSLGAFLWDAETGDLLRTFLGHTRRVNSVAFSPDGTRVLTGSWDGTARLWDVQTSREIRTFGGHTRWVCCVAFSPDGTRVLTGSWDATARIWQLLQPVPPEPPEPVPPPQG